MHPGDRLFATIFDVFDASPALDEVFFNGADVAASGSFRGEATLRQNLIPCLDSFFGSSLAVLDWLQDLATACNSRLDPMFPSAGGNVPERAARWHALFPPLVRNGPVFTVRRNRFASLTLDDFAIPDVLRVALLEHLQRGGSLLVSGPTGSGKSSFVAAILRQFFSSRRMVIIETVEELGSLSTNFLNMVVRPPNLAGAGAVTANWLFEEALRLRPDGIVIGEIRGLEASAFCSAVTSGHPSCFSTIHAGDVDQARWRLGWLAGLTGITEMAARTEMAGLTGMVIQLARAETQASVPAVVGFGSLSRLQ